MAKDLRQRQTPAEEILWAMLRGRRLLRLKFRRQQAIGPFIADFYCHEYRLVIEVDGGIHSTAVQTDRDRNRDTYFQEHLLRVLRFSNQQVLDDPESVLKRIAEATGRWDHSISAPSGSPPSGSSPSGSPSPGRV